MSPRTVDRPRSRRRRRDPADTQREILQAARELLRERPFRELTVERVMSGTGLKRPAFYVHFRDRHDLVLRVVEDIAGELRAGAQPWLAGDGDTEDDLRAGLEGVVHAYAVHAPVLRALADAAAGDARVEAAYRGLVDAFVDGVAARLHSDQAAGRIAAGVDLRELGRALVWLNERYLYESLGRSPQSDPAEVSAVLHRIWRATLYAHPG